MEMHYIMANPIDGRRLTHTMRYIDDILTLNSNLMKEVHSKIYDKSLPLAFDDTTTRRGRVRNTKCWLKRCSDRAR